jgi:hypothetical protein
MNSGGHTAAHDIVPTKAEALAFMMGGQQVFAKIVHHPGSRIPERSFMRSGLFDMADEIVAGIRAAALEGARRGDAMTIRNDAFDALLTIGKQIEPGDPGSEWGEAGRKMKPPEQALMPALFQVEGDSEYQSKSGQMVRREIQISWVIMHNFGKDQAHEPARYSSDLIDRIEAKLGEGVNIQSLGGRVFAAYIKGAIRRFPGDLDGIELITIPLSILLP